MKHSDSYMGITLGLLLFSLTSLISWGSLCLSNIHLLAVPSHVSVLMVQMPPPGLISLPLLLPTILIHHRIQHNLLCRSAPTSPWGAWEGGTQELCPEILSQEGNQKSQKSLFLHTHHFPGRGKNQSICNPLRCRLQLLPVLTLSPAVGKIIPETPQYRGTFYCGEPARGSLAEGFA